MIKSCYARVFIGNHVMENFFGISTKNIMLWEIILGEGLL